mgnify:CR=1 FL=1
MTTKCFTESQQLMPVVMKITQSRINHYADASGDFNPIHLDEKFASKSRFGRRIAHGMLIAAMISELMAKNFSDSWALSGKLKIRFRAPVYTDDTVTARGYVKNIENVNAQQIKIACVVEAVKESAGSTDEFGDTAITGQATVIVNL